VREYVIAYAPDEKPIWSSRFFTDAGIHGCWLRSFGTEPRTRCAKRTGFVAASEGWRPPTGSRDTYEAGHGEAYELAL